MEKMNYEGLREITGQESGVVDYGNEAIICNWDEIKGLPRIFAVGAPVGLGENLYIISIKHIDDIGAAISSKIIYDANNDAADIANCAGRVFEIATRSGGEVIATVYAPEGWH